MADEFDQYLEVANGSDLAAKHVVLYEKGIDPISDPNVKAEMQLLFSKNPKAQEEYINYLNNAQVGGNETDEFAQYIENPTPRPAIQRPQQPFTQGLGNIPIGGGDIPIGLDVGPYSQSLNQMAQPSAIWDAAKTIGAGSVLGPLAGIAGIAAMTPLSLLTGGGLERANDWVQAVQGLIPQPTTPGGQAWTGAMNAPNVPFESLEVGNRLEQAGAPWWLSAAGETAARATPVVALGAGGLKVQGAPTPLAIIDKKISTNIRNSIPKIVKPTVQNVKDWTQLQKKLGDYETAFPDMVKTVPDINLDTALMDASKANFDTKIKLWNQSHEMTVGTSKAGAKTDFKPFYEEGLRIATSDEMYKFNPAEAARLKEFIARVYEKNGRWVDPVVAEQDLARLNEMSRGFWQSKDPQYLGAGANSERLAHILRKQQYETVQRMEGTGYADLRKRLGAQMAIEKELSNRALVDLRKPEAGFFDLIYAPAVGDFLAGIVNLSPTQMVRGAAMYAAKNRLKARNDPNILMYKLWNKTRDLLEQRGEVAPPEIRQKPTPPLGLPEPAIQMGMQGQLPRGPTTLTEMYPQQPLPQGPPRLGLPAPTQIQMYGPNTTWERMATTVESPPKPYASLIPKPIGKYKAPEPNIIAEYMKKLQRVK